MNSTQNGESWSKNDFYEWKKDSLKRSVLLSGTSAVSISSVADDARSTATLLYHLDGRLGGALQR